MICFVDWIKTVWDSDFTECDELPPHLDDVIKRAVLTKDLQVTKRALQPWVEEEANCDQGTIRIA